MATITTTPSTPGDADQPKKVIRTLAGDIAALKQGERPGFVPFDGAPKDAGSEVGGLPPPPPMPPPTPMSPARGPGIIELPPLPPDAFASNVKKFEPPPLPPLPKVEPPLPPIPPKPKLPPPPPPPPPPKPKPPEISPLETYASDFSDRMKDVGASTATVLAAEEDAGEAPKPPEDPKPKTPISSILYAVGSIVLLLVGAAGAYAAYTRYLTNTLPVPLAPTISAPIFVDERAQVSGNGTELMQAIEESATKPLAPSAIRQLYLPLSTTTAESIFVALNLNAPDILLRNIEASGSMAGIVNANNTESPFFILSVDSYRDTFAGMLSWESLMPGALSPLYPAYTAAASTTQRAGFVDKVVADHDVRAYEDAAGRTVFLYGYWNDRTLVIARDKAAFTDILGRLASSRSR